MEMFAPMVPTSASNDFCDILPSVTTDYLDYFNWYSAYANEDAYICG